jgi:proteasome lid subunit RPN8/RPN11
MLKLPRPLLDEMYAHGEETFPRECCGILVGTKGGDGGRERVVTEIHPATNVRADDRNDRYELDPLMRKQVEEHAHDRGLQVVGFYHSHPDHDSYFSETDLKFSEEYIWGEPWIPPTYSYPVMSICDGKRVLVRSFEVEDGDSAEEELILLDHIPG